MSNREAVRKLLTLLSEYRKIIFFIMSCLLISTGINLTIPLLSRNIMDLGFIGGNKNLLIDLIAISAFVYAVNAFIDVVKEKKRIDISAKLEYSLTQKSFLHLMNLKADYFCKINCAEILSNINIDIGNIVSITDQGMFFLITQIFSIIGGVIGLFIIDFKLTLLVLLFIPCKYWIIKYLAKRRKILMDDFIMETQTYSSWLGDTIGGIHEVKLFNILYFKNKEFESKQKKVISKKKKMNMLGVWNNTSDILMVQFLIMFLYIVGANLVFDLKLSVGSVFAFITYSTYVTSPISGILNIGYMLSGIIPSTKRFWEFMNLQEEQSGQVGSIQPVVGSIELINVSFYYEQEKYILKNVNLTFKKGSKTAVMGKNGSGKSTIIGLMTRMYNPSQGKILLNGQDISNFLVNEYREMVSVVSQQIYLFNDTIRNNICLYKNIEDKLLFQVIIDSGLREFIDEVTLEYLVGQNGSLLSGGQKQKLAMARALIHNRPIVVFDEATSNTDVYSEKQINSLLHTRLKENTVIVVTHKQEVLKDMDSIVYLCGESVVNETYEELYKHNYEFRKMMELRDEL